MGVDSKIIDKYSVYSMETAVDMAKKITSFTLSDYGIGVTGKLKRKDKNNLYSSDNLVFISIYDKKIDKRRTLILKLRIRLLKIIRIFLSIFYIMF